MDPLVHRACVLRPERLATVAAVVGARAVTTGVGSQLSAVTEAEVAALAGMRLGGDVLIQVIAKPGLGGELLFADAADVTIVTLHVSAEEMLEDDLLTDAARHLVPMVGPRVDRHVSHLTKERPLKLTRLVVAAVKMLVSVGVGLVGARVFTGMTPVQSPSYRVLQGAGMLDRAVALEEVPVV